MYRYSTASRPHLDASCRPKSLGQSSQGRLASLQLAVCAVQGGRFLLRFIPLERHGVWRHPLRGQAVSTSSIRASAVAPSGNADSSDLSQSRTSALGAELTDVRCQLIIEANLICTFRTSCEALVRIAADYARTQAAAVGCEASRAPAAYCRLAGRRG